MINISRRIKNIITGSLLVVLIALNGFTVYKASNEITTTNTNNNIIMQDKHWSPPNMPDDGNGFQGGMNKGMTPPDRGNGEDWNNNSDNGVLEDIPDNDGVSDNHMNRQKPSPKSSEDSTFNENNDMVPTMPDKDNSYGGPHGNRMPPDGMINNLENTPQNNSLSTVYYVVFGVESLLIAFTIMYLVMSNFNKKSFKETFAERDKVLIFALATVLFTLSLTYLDNTLVTNLLSTNQTVITNISNE